MTIDLWYGADSAGWDTLDCSWSDCDCIYRGNLYKGGKAIGDYSTGDYQEIEKMMQNHR